MMPSEAIVVPLYFDLRTPRADRHPVGDRPAAGRAVGGVRHVLDAGLLPQQQPRLVEAARLDGASDRRILWQVLVPLARPAIVTLTVLIFMWTWNEFLIPLVMVTDESLRTAPLGLAFFQGQYTQGFTLLAAGAVIVALPVVAALPLPAAPLHRRHARGRRPGVTTPSGSDPRQATRRSRRRKTVDRLALTGLRCCRRDVGATARRPEQP